MITDLQEKTRSESTQKQTKQDKVSDLKFISTYNPALPHIHNIIQNNLSILHTGENVTKIFRSKSTKTLYRRVNIMKKILSPSIFPVKPKNRYSCITYCKKYASTKIVWKLIISLSVKLLVGFIMPEASYLATAVKQ